MKLNNTHCENCGFEWYVPSSKLVHRCPSCAKGVDYITCIVRYKDNINPSHYTYGEVETIDFIKSCGFAIDFCAGNVLKYVSRYKHKNGIEDIKKAQWYVNKMLELLEEVDSGDS